MHQEAHLDDPLALDRAAELEAAVDALSAQIDTDAAAARGSLEALHARALACGAEVAQAWAACHLSRACRLLNDLNAGLRWAREACGMMARLSEHLGEVTALGNHGTLWAVLGDIPKARELFARGLSLCDLHSVQAERGPLLINLAMTYGFEGDAAEYARRTQEAVALFRALGDRPRLAHSLANLGGGLARARALCEARAAYEESLLIAREVGLTRVEALCIGGLGEIAAFDGKLDDARALLCEAQALFLSQGHVYDAIYQMRLLIAALLDAGAHQEALAMIRAQLNAVEGADLQGLRGQLLFLRARAEEALGDLTAALSTTRERIDELEAIHAREVRERRSQQLDLQAALLEATLDQDQRTHADALRHANQALRRALGRARATNRSLTRHAMTDPLTGAANRRGLALRADIEVTRCAVADAPLSVIALDLDHFKSLNDSFGHTFGDGVLVEFARRLRSVIRSLDVLARVGGEEFVLLLPDCALAQAAVVAERALAATRAQPFGHLDASQARVSASAGVAQLDPTRGFEALLARADEALYVAKRSGRDQAAIARPLA